METWWLVDASQRRVRHVCLRHAGLQDVFNGKDDESCPVVEMVDANACY